MRAFAAAAVALVAVVTPVAVVQSTHHARESHTPTTIHAQAVETVALHEGDDDVTPWAVGPALQRLGAWLVGVTRHAAPAVPPVPAARRPEPAPKPVTHASRPVSVQPAATGQSGAAGSSIGACVRRIESSGDYTVTNSVGASGAYQYMPSTWNHYASAAGYGQYANGRAASAPPAVQDAVFNYTIANGGGSNWSGPDPCTGH